MPEHFLNLHELLTKILMKNNILKEEAKESKADEKQEKILKTVLKIEQNTKNSNIEKIKPESDSSNLVAGKSNNEEF
jgi:hypothetical protein